MISVYLLLDFKTSRFFHFVYTVYLCPSKNSYVQFE